MANNSEREALRGLEVPLFDLMAQVLAPEEWTKSLEDLLERAAFVGERELAQRLVRSGVPIGSALHGAVGGGHGDIANDLLELGASVEATDEYGRTPLHRAIRMAQPEMVQLLLLNGADKDAWDDNMWTTVYTAAYTTIHSGDPAILFALLAAGAEVNLRSDTLMKRLPLHMAAFKAGVDVLRALIEHGNDVNSVDFYQDTPLHCAALGNSSEAIDFLVAAGANIGARNGVGYTPLQYAATQLNVNVLRGLLTHDTAINAQTLQDRTALHVAVAHAGKQGSAEFVDLLLRSGADETIVDEDNKVAADVIGERRFRRGTLAEEIERVRELLANAPADRAWRRRGYLAMCRAHPCRMQLGREISSEDASVGRRVVRRTGSRREKQAQAGVNGSGAIVEDGTVGERAGGGWAGVVAKVLGFQEEGIFRAIVGYL